MNKDLLKNPIVVEVGKDGKLTIYYSRTQSKTASSLLVDLASEGVIDATTPPRPYCHNCFDFECDTDEQLKEHEKECLAEPGRCITCGKDTTPDRLLFYCREHQGQGTESSGGNAVRERSPAAKGPDQLPAP